MPSHELELSYSAQEADFKLRQDVAKSLATVSFVFNEHGNRSDAEQSASYIQPNSLVFIEGVNFEATFEYARLFEKEIEALNAIRILNGIESGQYQNFKREILIAINHELARLACNDTAPVPGTYNEHALTLLSSLLEMDCVIHCADYQWNPIDNEGHTMFNESFSGSSYNLSTDDTLIQDLSEGGAIKQLFAQYDNDLRLHQTRERGVIDAVVNYIGGYCLHGYLPSDLASDEPGKVNAYVIFGSAHEKSLTNLFNKCGFTTKEVIRISPMCSHEFLPIDKNDLTTLRLRKLAYLALYFANDVFHDEVSVDAGGENLESIIDSIVSDNEKLLRTVVLYGRMRSAMARRDYADGKQAAGYLIELAANNG